MMISVVIPVLNELIELPPTLSALREQDWVDEIIVVDGGSKDGTREWLNRQDGIRVIDGPTGKGPQLNAGATIANGDILLFLHADCQLPPHAGDTIRAALSDQGSVGGCFWVRFAQTQPRSLGWVSAGINARSTLRRSGTGDQAIFVRRDVFRLLGGFPEWPLFEDVEFVNRCKLQGKFVVIRSVATISARRYLTFGIWRTVLLIYTLRLAFWVGVSPYRLKRLFEDIRPHLGRSSHSMAEKPESATQTDFSSDKSQGSIGREVRQSSIHLKQTAVQCIPFSRSLPGARR